MAKFRSSKNSFIAGQISSVAMGRVDLPQYAHACKTLQNVIPLVSGGVYRRPGTMLDYFLSASTNTYFRLIPFVVSQSESYMLGIFRTSLGGADVFVSRPTNTTAPSVITTAVHTTSIKAHDYVYDSNTLLEEYDAIQYAQSVDVMTLVHPNRKPKKIYRIATDSFEIADFDTVYDPGIGNATSLAGTALRDAWPYRRQNKSSITLAINTASVGTGRVVTSSLPFFNAGHVGAMFKLDSDGAGTIGSFRVTGFTNSTTVTVQVYVAIDSTAPSLLWWESAWSDYRGWPRSVAFYQGRIAYGGNATDRDSIFFSQTSNFDIMSVDRIVQAISSGDGVTTGPTGLQPFTLEMSSQQLNQIQWMSPDRMLTVGTIGDEFIVESDGTSGGFTCNNAKVTPQSHYGSSHHVPVRAGDELIFVLKSDDEIKSLVFNLLQNAYNAEAVQMMFKEYPKPDSVNKKRKYRSIAWDQSRKTLWCVDTAGNLFGMTRDRSLGVTAWHTHRFGGFDESVVDATGVTGVLCTGSVVSVAVAPNPSLGMNDVWVTVRRKIGADWQWHVERFMGEGISSDSIDSPALAASGNYFVDACVYGVNAFQAGTTEDFNMTVVANGFLHLLGLSVVGTAEKLSGRGIFTLKATVPTASAVPVVSPRPPDYATAGYGMAYGLPFDSIVVPVRIEAGSQIGTAQGAIKRIHKATVRFYRTLSAKIGSSADLLETFIFRQGSTPMDESPELFSGDKPVDLEGDYDRDGYIYLLQDQPLPFCVTSIVAEGMTYD